MAPNSSQNTAQYPLTVFFDGDCPICRREITLMEWLDRKGKLRFVNFAEKNYDEQSYGFSRSELGGVIHAQWADGLVIKELEVFRAMWRAVGLGGLAKLSQMWFLESLLVRGYKWFARHRLALTGRKKPQISENTGAASTNPTTCQRCQKE